MTCSWQRWCDCLPGLGDESGRVAALTDVNSVKVVGSEGGVALGALPLTCVVARLDTLEAEDVEALSQHGILHPRVAAWTR